VFQRDDPGIQFVELLGGPLGAMTEQSQAALDAGVRHVEAAS
jgi:hypothetical protein